MQSTRMVLVCALAAACTEVEKPHTHLDEQELITTVIATFTPEAGEPLTFTWTDPENDGDPEIDEIVLLASEVYTLDLRFVNDASTVPEEITEEVEEESAFHQIFLLGDAIDSAASPSDAAIVSFSYGDTDSNGDPLGLHHTLDGLSVGEGTLDVVLRHLPLEGEVAVKTSELAQSVSDGGLTSIGGDTDIYVSFPISIQ